MKPGANRKYKQNNQGKNLTKHIYIPGTVRRSALCKSMMKQLGDEHHSRMMFTWKSSNSVTPNPVSLMIGMPLIEQIPRWGNDVYKSTFGNSTFVGTPQYDKILLKHIRIRIIISQVQENCKYRICLARMKRSTYPGPNSNARSGWGTAGTIIDDFTPARDWNIMWEHKGVFDDPIQAPGGTTETILRKEREVNLYLPFDRVISNRLQSTVTEPTDWLLGTTDSDYTYLHFDTDDAINTDGEYLNFKVLMETVWCECD